MKNSSLRTQLFAGISIVFLAIVVGLLYQSIAGTRDYLERQLASHSQDAATSLAHPLSLSLGRDDKSLATIQVMTLFDRGYFQRISVIGVDGALLVNRELPAKIEGVPEWFSRWVTLNAQPGESFITAGWRQLGKVAVISQPTYAYQHLWNTVLETTASMALAYAIALILTYFVLRLILKPLSEIEHAAREISQRRFVQISRLPGAKELARVVRAMNSMSRRIAEIIQAESDRAEGFRKQAYQDEVTGLDNRRSFDLRLEQLLASEQIFSHGAAIGVEIDNLKALNTGEGYQRGNELVRSFAETIVTVLGEHCAIAGRTGGTSFAFIVVNQDGPALNELSRALQSRLDVLIKAAAGDSEVSFSIGVVNFQHSEKRSRVMARLDLVLESARQSGHNALQLAPESGAAVEGLGSLGWRELIQNALHQNRWRLVGQPVINLGGKQVIHLEIMSRLVGEDGQLVPASQFMPMALRHQLMPEIDRALLELVSRVVSHGADQSIRFAINMSNQSLGSKDFVRWFEAFLGRLGGHASSLSFELTEYACAMDTLVVREFASMVRKAGATFGIDNFGLSPTALQTLREIPPDYIKLAAGLVSESLTDENARALLRSTVALAYSLEVEVIAQGVETLAQVEMLIADRVMGGQGYHFGAPVPDGLNG